MDKSLEVTQEERDGLERITELAPWGTIEKEGLAWEVALLAQIVKKMVQRLDALDDCVRRGP